MKLRDHIGKVFLKKRPRTEELTLKGHIGNFLYLIWWRKYWIKDRVFPLHTGAPSLPSPPRVSTQASCWRSTSCRCLPPFLASSLSSGVDRDDRTRNRDDPVKKEGDFYSQHARQGAIFSQSMTPTNATCTTHV